MYHLLKSEFNRSAIKVGRDRFFNILRENKLLIRRKKRYQMTTNSKHIFKKYPNLIKDLQIYRKYQLWVSDITYIRTDEGFAYAAMIRDVFSRKIVGSSIAKTMTTTVSTGCITSGSEAKERLFCFNTSFRQRYSIFQQYYINVLESNDIR